MYAKDRSTIIDKREMLRVKLKSLAEEARIIRFEEKRTWGRLRDELHLHRVNEVRSEARASHLAYGLIKGRSFEQMECTKPERSRALMERVKKLITKYGPLDAQAKAQLLERCQ